MRPTGDHLPDLPMANEQPWFVYLLECENGRLYTGISTDPARRLDEHRSGRGAMFTRLNRPQRLLAVQRCASRSEALRLEWRTKQLKAADKRLTAQAWDANAPLPVPAPVPDNP